MFLYQKKLQPIYEKSILEILVATEQEFVPPLSSRSSTTQKNLIGSQNIHGIMEYYEQLLHQEFILAIEDETVMGFLTFIPNHSLSFEGKNYKCDYVTTIIVSSNFRGRGLAPKMYDAFFDARKGSNFATRTWSTNQSHLKILKDQNFRLIALLPNDRGNNIDTVYYFKEGEQSDEK